MDFTRKSRSEAETSLIGEALGALLRHRLPDTSDIILIDGPLGAGKTTFARAVARGFGLDDATISSPTFTIIHEHDTPAGRGLIHVDAYRLGGESDLESIGWDRVMERVDSGGAILLVEWAERLGPAFLSDRPHARIRIEHRAENEREFSFTIPDVWAGRPGLAELAQRRPTRCPITGEQVPSDSPSYPFSSERARLADLHRWFSSAYQISRPMEERDLEEGID